MIELDRKQPEFKLNFNQYLKRYLNDKNKKRLKKNINENKILLKKIEKKFGVDSKVLVSLWFVETSFGEYLGKFDILNSLASLTYDGRRKDFFLKELKYALKSSMKVIFLENNLKVLGLVHLGKLNLCQVLLKSLQLTLMEIKK